MWGTFDRLLGQLGEGSRYAKALADDPVLARQVLEEDEERSESSSSWRPSHRDWTLMHTLVTRVGDLMGKAWFKDFDLFPVPLSALDAMRDELEEQRLQAGYDRVLDEVEAAQERWRAMSQEERDALGVEQ